MSGYNNHEEEDQVPPLFPIKKKKTEYAPLVSPNSEKNSNSNDVVNSFIANSVKASPINQSAKDNSFNQSKKQPNAEKIEEIDKKSKEKISTMQKKENNYNKIQNEKTKENEKMKAVIAQLLSEISVKNLTEELYPVSNEVIQQLINKIEEQISELRMEAEKKDSSLAANQNNLHLKKQIETIKREIDHCCLIKELYYEKMHYRNKIQSLEEAIISLRSENKDLKIKVSRGIETIENYKHNLPCDREKELKQKLTVTSEELRQEKEMRQNLEKNIGNIIMNFKRLYDEADAARQIVTKKLREIEERERKIRKMKFEEEESHSQDMNAPRRMNNLEVTEDKKNQASYQLDSSGDFNNQNTRKGSNQQDQLKRMKGSKGIPNRQKQQKDKKAEAPVNQTATLEQKINKMRSNQFAFTKAFAN